MLITVTIVLFPTVGQVELDGDWSGVKYQLLGRSCANHRKRANSFGTDHVPDRRLADAGRLGFDLQRPVFDVLPEDLLTYPDRPLERPKDDDIADDIVDPEDTVPNGVIHRCSRSDVIPVDLDGWYPFVHSSS